MLNVWIKTKSCLSNYFLKRVGMSLFKVRKPINKQRKSMWSMSMQCMFGEKWKKNDNTLLLLPHFSDSLESVFPYQHCEQEPFQLQHLSVRHNDVIFRVKSSLSPTLSVKELDQISKNILFLSNLYENILPFLLKEIFQITVFKITLLQNQQISVKHFF